MSTRSFGIGVGGLTTGLTDQSHAGFFGFGYSSYSVYQCLAKSLTQTIDTSDTATFGGETDVGGFVTPIDPAEFAAGELWLRYYVTAGADGALVSLDDITVTVTFSTDVSGSQSVTDTFLRSDSLLGAAIGNGRIVAVGANSEILYSTDRGANWAYATSPVECDFRDVIHDGRGTFYACGTNGVVLSSADGVTWNIERNDRTSDYLDLTIARTAAVTAIASNDTLVAKTLTSGGFNYIGRFA